MRPLHMFYALLVATIWGINFIFIKLALDNLSPILLCVLRFSVVSIPAIFFVKHPKLSFKTMVCYSASTFAFQFVFLFMGMHAGMSPGLTSIVCQTQVFFSLLFAFVFMKEQPTQPQMIGALIAFIGICMIGVRTGLSGSWLGFFLIIGAALSWGVGNAYMKKFSATNGISMIIWGSFYATWPLLICSIVLEGPPNFSQMMLQPHQGLTILSIFYIAYISTVVGYGLWAWLLGQYNLSSIVPFGLLIPMIGMISSIVFFGETIEPVNMIASGLVILGLCINVFGSQVSKRVSKLGWIRRNVIESETQP